MKTVSESSSFTIFGVVRDSEKQMTDLLEDSKKIIICDGGGEKR